MKLLRFNGGVKREPTIEAWFKKKSAQLEPAARKYFTLMRQCGPDVRELMHDGAPTACVESFPQDTRRQKRYNHLR